MSVPGPSESLSVFSPLLFCCVIVLAALFVLIATDSRMIVRSYSLHAGQISARIRIALITDLHACRYGDRQSSLLRAIDAQSPDLVVFSGDIFDSSLPDDNAECFLTAIAGRYPCYFAAGNHEYRNGAEIFRRRMAFLRSIGIAVLSGDCLPVAVNSQTINICGVDDPYISGTETSDNPEFLRQLERAAAAADNGSFTLLLSHRPEFFDLYVSHGFDLVLAGHAHGGQWRIPGLINGLYVPTQGLFPPYTGGQYIRENTTMIVSRGLARESVSIPRIFNRPELVIIDL